VTRSTGNGVPDHTDRNLANIKNKAEINSKLPIITLTESFIFHPILISIPNYYSVYIFGYIIFMLVLFFLKKGY